MCLDSKDCNQMTCMCGLQPTQQSWKPQQLPKIDDPNNPCLPQMKLPTSSNLLSAQLLSLIRQQSMMIKIIAEQTQAIAQRLNSVSQKIETQRQLPELSLDTEQSKMQNLMQMLSGSEQQHQYFLELRSEIPNPAYKERAFSLELQIVDQQKNPVRLSQRVLFKVLLFTTENPPKLLKSNTSGDKIMRGTLEQESQGQLLFQKIVIKEVTSHFRNGCFYLVVAPQNQPSIRPFVIDNLVIKARKTSNTKTQIMKIPKLNEIFIEEL